MKNLVSIIVPAYNSAAFLAETLDSVLAQSYAEWECVVVDDGSTDATAAVAEEYARRDGRIVLIRQSNQGVAAARNRGIGASHGKYILPLDADDVIAPPYVAEAVAELDSRPGVRVVYCNAEKFGRKKGLWPLPEFDYKLLLSQNLIFCSAMYRRSDYDLTPGYDPCMPGMEDWDFWLSLIHEGDTVVRLAGVYFFYRTHKMSRNRMANRNIENIYRQIYLNHRELYTGYIDNPILVRREWERDRRRFIFLRFPRCRG